MQVVRHYRVKVHAIGTDSGDPFGQCYGREVTDALNIAEAVSEGVASALSDGMRVHSVIVEPFAAFVP